MSKWISKSLFSKFQQEKREEKEKPAGGGVRRSDLVWKTPEKGTDTTPKVYEGRFLVDKKGNFYKKYHYHMFKAGEKWMFVICPKTFHFENFCAFCSVTSKLYTGSSADKTQAASYKRKEKYVSNFYIVDDPRDNEREEEQKVNGTVKLYEFPGKVEIKLKEEITDSRNGLGPSIFDPGPDGYNFILKVLSTKKDARGNIWPDYSNSAFSRRPSSLGTDEEINKIMSSTYDLDEYISSLEKTDDEIISVLKSEMLWSLVESEWRRYKSGPDTTPKTAVAEEKAEESPFKDDSEVASEALSDEDLLKELEDL